MPIAQVHYGLYTEWVFSTGNLHPVPESAKHAWLALIIVRHHDLTKVWSELTMMIFVFHLTGLLVTLCSGLGISAEAVSTRK